MSTLYILWDESHIWGLLAWRAVKAFGLPFRMVRAKEIAQGLLSGKRPEVLIAPGGVARRKAELLGPEGMEAIRSYIESGGAYVGFCGGAGLGLTGRHGLGLCPWTRDRESDRMLHLVSGHIHVALHGDSPLIPPNHPPSPLVPVWWPARFAAVDNPSVQVLAAYADPGEDFWMADLPLSALPGGTFSKWSKDYGITFSPKFMAGRPCVIHGQKGEGSYLLSYAHLETPDSPQANQWLAHILCAMSRGAFCGSKIRTKVPPWDLSGLDPVWDDPDLVRARRALDSVIKLGLDHFLLFKRNPWLLGWRTGIPGANLNNLRSLLVQAANLPPTESALKFLDQHRENLAWLMQRFQQDAKNYLLAERLAMTLAKSSPDTVPAKGLIKQRTALFGQPMEQGGLYAELIDILDGLMRRQIRPVPEE